MRFLPWFALASVSGAASFYWWQLPSAHVGLRIANASADQIRITWRRDSAPALLARSAALEIRDGASLHRLLLTPEELRAGSITYQRETADVRVRLNVDAGANWAGLDSLSETAGFHGPLLPAREFPDAPMEAAAAPLPVFSPEPPHDVPETAEPSADRVRVPVRQAVIPASLRSGSADDPPPIPPAPSLAMPRPVVGSLALAMPAPGAIPPGTPRQPVYNGPRFGRIIWTGAIGRRGVVEIEGAHASLGSLSAGLPGVPVTLRVSPADFSEQGLVIHTDDGSYNGRREIASAANGWNATVYRWEPALARELVVLEAPNPSNDFKRLVVRSDARSCRVIVVEWNVR